MLADYALNDVKSALVASTVEIGKRGEPQLHLASQLKRKSHRRDAKYALAQPESNLALEESKKLYEIAEAPFNEIILGHALDVLPRYPNSCVDLIFTSPPYADSRKKTYGGSTLR